MDTLKAAILRMPKVFHGLGLALFNLGAALVVFGMFGRIGLFAIGAASRGTVKPANLGVAYPTLPTWWIPESWLGFTIALAFGCAGLWTAATAKRCLPRAGRKHHQ